MRSFYYFVNNRIDDAIAEYDNITEKDITWLYNLGFLMAFKGDVEGAWSQYRRAFYGTASPNVITDTEVFISEVINKYPEKVQLLFFRGLINYKVKKDYVLAAQDFEEFVRAEGSLAYPNQVSVAKKYLFLINSDLGVQSPYSDDQTE